MQLKLHREKRLRKRSEIIAIMGQNLFGNDYEIIGAIGLFTDALLRRSVINAEFFEKLQEYELLYSTF